MVRLNQLLIHLSLLALVSCTTQRVAAPSANDSVEAAKTVAALERDLSALSRLTGKEKNTAELAFGPRLAQDLAVCQGTRHENWPLFQLAAWTLAHGTDNAAERVLIMLDRLERLPAEAYRGFPASELRVKSLLHLGRISEARHLATQVDTKYPATSLLNIVAFYELVGTAAPPIPGISVGADTLTDSPTLICFIGTPDSTARAWIEPYQQSLSENNAHMVVVVTEGDMLAAAAAANNWSCNIRWIKSRDPSLSGAWQIPGVPVTVLLSQGPKRIILAVNPQPMDLRQFFHPR